MSKTYTAGTNLREARPRSKRLRGLGMPGTAAVQTEALKRSDADALYHPLRGRSDLPLTLKDLTFAPVDEASPSAMLEVLAVDGVQYLHTRLPFFSDQAVSCGGRGPGGGSGGGITAISVNGGDPVGPAAGSSVVVLNDIASAAALAALSGAVSVLAEAVNDKISMPSGGSAGQYLRKTVSGVEWASVSGGGDDTATYLGAKLGIQVATNPSQSNGKILKGAGVDSMGRLTATWVDGDFATEAWVQQQGFLTAESLSGYATETWVQQQGFLTAQSLSGYATQLWVQGQGYLTQHQSLTDYYTSVQVDSKLAAKADLNGSAQQAFRAKGITLYNANGDSVTLDIDNDGHLRINGAAYSTISMAVGGNA